MTAAPIPLRVLLIEDEEDDAILVQRTLIRGGFVLTHFSWVDNEADMVAQLEQESYDILLSDYRLPHFSAPRALEALQRTGRDIPFIVISGTIGEETAVEMMKSGAADYLLKDKLDRLAPAIARELREAAGRRERHLAEGALRESRVRLSTVINSASDAIVSVDEAQQIVVFNPAAENMFGCSTQEALGAPLKRFLPEVSYAKWEHKEDRDDGQPEALWIKRTDGSELPVEIAISRAPLSEGGLYTAVIRDISERLEVERARREAAQEREQALLARAETARQQRAFLRDVLYSVTEGRLTLCDSEADLPRPLPVFLPPGEARREDEGADGEGGMRLPPTSLAAVRRRVREAGQTLGFVDERWYDLMSAASECAMNALQHGNDTAYARVCAEAGVGDGGKVQVWISDQGRGISVADLPKATLMKGHSGGGSFGHGFYIVLHTVDAIYLLTGPGGTTVVLEQNREIPLPGFLKITNHQDGGR